MQGKRPTAASFAVIVGLSGQAACGARAGLDLGVGLNDGAAAGTTPGDANVADSGSARDVVEISDAVGGRDAVVIDGSGDAGASLLAECDGVVDKLVLHGDPGDVIYTGTLELTGGTWLVDVSPVGAEGADQLSISVRVSADQNWNLALASGTPGVALGPGALAARNPRAAGVAWFDVTGNGHGCDVSQSTVTIGAIAVSGMKVTDFQASFQQTCTQPGSQGVLRGCVRVSQ